jgi:hypothetical protein
VSAFETAVARAPLADESASLARTLRLPCSPRKAGLSRETRADLLSEFAGLSRRWAESRTAVPALAKTRYSGLIGHGGERRTTAPVALLATSRCTTERCGDTWIRVSAVLRRGGVRTPSLVAAAPVMQQPMGDQRGALRSDLPPGEKIPIVATSTEVVDWMFHWDPRVAYPYRASRAEPKQPSACSGVKPSHMLACSVRIHS